MAVLSQLTSEKLLPSDAGDLWMRCVDQRGPTFGLAFGRPCNSVAQTYALAEPARPPRRIAAAIGLIILTVVAVWGARVRSLWQMAGRWPHAIATVVGLAWWLWMRPSVLGWVIMLVSLGGWLLAWQRRRRPELGSSVVRVAVHQS